jgi:hypothetical protein
MVLKYKVCRHKGQVLQIQSSKWQCSRVLTLSFLVEVDISKINWDLLESPAPQEYWYHKFTWWMRNRKTCCFKPLAEEKWTRLMTFSSQWHWDSPWCYLSPSSKLRFKRPIQTTITSRSSWKTETKGKVSSNHSSRKSQKFKTWKNC